MMTTILEVSPALREADAVASQLGLKLAEAQVEKHRSSPLSAHDSEMLTLLLPGAAAAGWLTFVFWPEEVSFTGVGPPPVPNNTRLITTNRSRYNRFLFIIFWILQKILLDEATDYTVHFLIHILFLEHPCNLSQVYGHLFSCLFFFKK